MFKYPYADFGLLDHHSKQKIYEKVKALSVDQPLPKYVVVRHEGSYKVVELNATSVRHLMSLFESV